MLCGTCYRQIQSLHLVHEVSPKTEERITWVVHSWSCQQLTSPSTIKPQWPPAGICVKNGECMGEEESIGGPHLHAYVTSKYVVSQIFPAGVRRQLHTKASKQAVRLFSYIPLLLGLGGWIKQSSHSEFDEVSQWYPDRGRMSTEAICSLSRHKLEMCEEMETLSNRALIP